MVKLLFYYAESDVGVTYSWMNRVCSYYGAEIVVVDQMGHFSKPKNTHAFPTLEVAIEAHPGFELVFLDPDGRIVLDEFDHPRGDVMYLFGHNIDGFGGYPTETTVRLRKFDEIYPLEVASMVMYDRSLFLLGRRR